MFYNTTPYYASHNPNNLHEIKLVWDFLWDWCVGVSLSDRHWLGNENFRGIMIIIIVNIIIFSVSN